MHIVYTYMCDLVYIAGSFTAKPPNAKFSRTLETKTKKTVKTLFFFKYNKENNHA